MIFLSTLSLRRATVHTDIFFVAQNDFYPRSPCGERPWVSSAARAAGSIFLSTLSLRRATWLLHRVHTQRRNFYPRSPCGERHLGTTGMGIADCISIHALLAESDQTELWTFLPLRAFLSTLSLRRATKRSLFVCLPRKFLSTLSLRRATFRAYLIPSALRHFYPRSPCGERR